MKLAIVFLICIGFSQFALAEMIDNQDGTVTDTNTNLMWQKYSSESLSRSQATIHIEQLNWGDYSNWRYPTNTELFGVFTSTSGCYWYNSDDQGICFTSYGFEYAFTQTGKVFAVRNIEEEPEPITYTQEELDQAVLQERLKWDAIGDNKIGLPEAIKALQVLSGSIEQTQSVEWNIERITSNSDWDNNPSLYDGNIAWSKQDAPRGLRYFDGNDISELNSGLANLGNKPSLHNGSIAFAGWKTSTGSSQVYLYDGNSVSQISNSTVRVLYSSLHSNQVAWAEFVGGTDNSNTEIIFYDGSSIRQLTDNNVKDVAPSLYNGQIAWSSFDGNDDEILFFDGTTTHQITDNNYNDSAGRYRGLADLLL